MPKAPRPPDSDTQPIPGEGALGLLAVGYRGLEAWREARGRDWIEERQREWEAAKRAREAKQESE